VEINSSGAELGHLDHESWSLQIKATDTEKIELFKQIFNGPQLSSLFQQLNLVTRLTSADRYSGRSTPRACYQASIRPLPEHKSIQLDVVALWEDSLEIPDFVHMQDPVLEVFAKYALQENSDRLASRSGRREHRERLLGYPQGWSPRQFYESVHVPPDTKSASAEIHCPELACQLFPFQRRAVRWLLRREGVELQNDGRVTPIERTASDDLPASYNKMTDADGNTCYFSHLFMTITTNINHWSDAADYLRGGILAEEMGLGKTVEMIALINLNRRLATEKVKFDPEGLRPSVATLIITPPAILEQWKQEIEQHAPGLRVHHYTGIKRGQEKSDDLVIEEIADFDVVLTTYNVISREIHYAGAAPKRSLRHEKKFEPRKTPLVRISWWRVCLDEAQMIESGVSNAAKVARLIPRENAWAVTGTPLRKNIDDLFGLLLFLHYRPFSDSSTLWKRLFSRFGPVLVKVINATALRHSKDRVRDELRLPPQKRVVITTPFTAVEEQHYGQLFEEMCEQCGLDASGAPLRSDWNPEDPGTVERMRTWLTRLRQTCLHPEVSGSNRRALGAANGPLRTVDEVLEVMVENTDTSIRTEERTLLLSQLRRGQLLENAKRRKESLAIWQSALEYSTELVEDSRTQLRLQRLKSKDDNATHMAGSTELADLSDEDSEEVDKNSRVGQCRLRLRAALEVQHIAVFFTANAYYQIKSDPSLTQPDSDDFKSLEKKEEEGYEAAKLIRKEMLTDISRKVERYMKIIKEKTQQKRFVQIPKLEPQLYNRGLVSYRLINKFEDLCEALNKHAVQYNEWRTIMVQLVSQSLIDQEEDAELEGNEYERSTKHQDEMYVYMEALRSMYADRHDALTGQKNILISHEVKLGIIQAQKGEGPSPELFLRIMNTRSDLMPDPELGSLRGIVSELRSLVTSLEWQAGEGSSRATAELEIVGMVLKNAGQMISEQLKVSSMLEREVEMFRDTMNNRLEYYRHLQQISDTVAPYDEENAGKPLNEDVFASKLEQEEALEKKIASLKSKRRYLIHLRDESGSEDTSRICIICQSSFEVGRY
jgi:E3 ubiquitin-protein ligase SHPRH